MSKILSSSGVTLDFDALYERMWNLASDDRGDRTRLFTSTGDTSLKWIIAEMSGSPAVSGRTVEPNNTLRSLVHQELVAGGWARRTGERTFRLRRPPRAVDEFAALHELMSVVPAARWITYGDLGQAAGIHPNGLGSHIKNKPCCPNAVRVLQAGGRPHASNFTWSDPDDEDLDPNEILRSEGLRFVEGVADPEQRLGVPELLELVASEADAPPIRWPTIEWVASHGDARALRHFKDCPSLGESARSLAPLDQLVHIEPCGDCRSRAIQAHHVESGRSLGGGLPGPADIELHTAETDVARTFLARREQGYLRRYLLDDRTQAPCDICGRLLPNELLVAAHIVPRARLNEAERLDFSSAAMLACTLGCDAMFETGHIAVSESGKVVALKPASTSAVADLVSSLQGLAVSRHNPATAPRFAAHARLFSDSPGLDKAR